jgi:outer membrane lipoprotein-sorting protein
VIRAGSLLALVAFLGVSPALGAAPLASVATLVKRLQTSGRGEATLTQTVVASGETLRADRGRLSLEPPDRMRIDFKSSGEQVTMRADGGEWIQPSLRQLLVLRPDQAQAVVSAWQAFLDGGAGTYRETSRGSRRYRLIPLQPGEGSADSIDVEVGADQLPRRLQLWIGDQRWWLTLSSWTFAKPKGSVAFTLRAPAGYSVFEWP